jgi:hypothetical protein
MAEDVQAEELLTLIEVRDAFDIKERTLYGWLREVKIKPVWVDGKNKGITRAQFNQLAFAHRRIPRADISAAEWLALLQRVTALEQQVAALTQNKSQGQSV